MPSSSASCLENPRKGLIGFQTFNMGSGGDNLSPLPLPQCELLCLLLSRANTARYLLLEGLLDFTKPLSSVPYLSFRPTRITLIRLSLPN